MLVDLVHGTGKKERKGVRQVRPRTGGPQPPASRPPLGKGSARPAPGGAHAPRQPAPTDYPLLPRPSPGPRAPARRERGQCGGSHPKARRHAGGAPPPLRRSRRPGPPRAHPTRAGRAPTPAGRPGGGARDPPTDRPLPLTPGAGQGGGRGREGSGDREAGPRRGRRRNTRLPPRQGRRDA